MELKPLTTKQKATIRYSLEPECRIAVWEGAVSSGKTICSLLAWAAFVAEAPQGATLIMVGKTFSTLRRNAFEPLIALLGEENVEVSYGSGTATIFGKQVHLLGADNSQAEGKIRGLSVYGAYLDELTLLGGPSAREWWEMLRTRMRVQGARIFATTNPGSPTSWLLTDYLNRSAVHVTGDGYLQRNLDAPEGVGLYRFSFVLDDNKTLDPAYVTSLKSSYSGVFFDRFILGLWVQAEGAVYQLDKNTHLISAPQFDPLTEWVVGIDHGMTNDTSAVLVAVDRQNQRLVVCGEKRVDGGNNQTVRQQTAEIVDWIVQGCDGVLPERLRDPDEISVVCDPAARAFRNEWHSAGYRFPKAADNKVLEGISDVSGLLGNNRLYFTQQTAETVLWKELTGYRWEEGKDAPIKEADHGPDALRYAIRSCKPTWKPWQTVVREQPEQDRIFNNASYGTW